MPGTDATRTTLAQLVESCERCKRDFDDNVAVLVADDNGVLTDAQAEAVLHHLQRKHKREAHEGCSIGSRS